jgi:DNA repair protein RadC
MAFLFSGLLMCNPELKGAHQMTSAANNPRHNATRIPRCQNALVREQSITWPALKFSNGRDVWEFGKELTQNAGRGQFRALMIDSKRTLIGVKLVAQGSLSASIEHPCEVLKPEIHLSAAAIVVIDHRTSGNPVPSRSLSPDMPT